MTRTLKNEALEVDGIYDVGLSWVTSSIKFSSIDRWLDFVSVKARPIPNLRSVETTRALVSRTPSSLRIRSRTAVPSTNGLGVSM
jgi:hypothetical protein